MLGMSTPQEGRHHDLYEIRKLFSELCELLKEAGIEVSGLFLNGDPGFDSEELREIGSEKDIEANIKVNPRNKTSEDDDIVYRYFDEQLYKRRTVIEHANAWLDSFKALLVRYEVLTKNWMAMHWMAFSVRFLRKFNSS